MCRPRITRENYRDRVADLEREIKRAQLTPALRGHERYLLAGIATMHWEFGNFDEARQWYEKAIAASRSKDPNVVSSSIAIMYWMAGNQASMKAECLAIIEDRGQKIHALAQQGSASDETRHALMLAHLDLAISFLLLRDYSAAEKRASLAGTLQTHGPTTIDAIQTLTTGLKARNKIAFDKALRALRGMLRKWPTFESDSTIDLYRVAQFLGRQEFGAIPDDLAAEDLYPAKWTTLLARTDPE